MLINNDDLIIVRHSERIDEVDPEAWFETASSKLKKGMNTHTQNSIFNDPFLTENGIKLAYQTAKTLKKSLVNNKKEIVLYTSKLTRCVQTAHMIAMELNLPLHVSSGLALTAKAVADSNGNFVFKTIEELTQVYLFIYNIFIIIFSIIYSVYKFYIVCSK
jgi:hypothetical protein